MHNSQFQQPGRTSLSKFQQPGLTSFEQEKTSLSQFQPVSTTRKNQFELVTASFNDNEKPVWAAHSQFQWQGRTSLSQFLEELVCLFHAQQPVSTTSHNQFELVSTTRKNQFWASHNQFQSQGKMVWASYSQFQQAVRTRKNQFELDTASFNDKENQFWASFNTQEEPVLS